MTPDPSLILKAFSLCVTAHEGQIDRDGLPHAFHCLRVAEKQTTPRRIIIALLHDTLEDSDVPYSHIAAEFGHHIAIAVFALTREKEESWSSYITRVCQNDDAMWVKKADLEDNTRVERVDMKAAAKMPMYKEAHLLITNKLAESAR